jgi:hypothetical protein
VFLFPKEFGAVTKDKTMLRGPSTKSGPQQQRRNTPIYVANELRAPAGPQTPVIAGPLLRGRPVSFIEFLTDPTCETLCDHLLGGAGTAAGTVFAEFRKATAFHYFGHRRGKPGQKNKPTNPGKLTATNSAEKKLLKKFARLAYRGDPAGRGQAFWERVAWLVWNAYASVMALRARAEKIKQQETHRVAHLPAKRHARAAYMRRYRAQRDAKKSRYFKPAARQAWRKRAQERAAVKPASN